MAKKLFQTLICFTLILITSLTYGKSQSELFVDVIAFKSDSSNYEGRVDCFVVVPYSMLEFKKIGDYYVSSIDVNIEIKDKSGNLIKSELIQKRALADSYYESQGGDASFKTVFFQEYLDEGIYEVKISIKDKQKNSFFEEIRSVNILNYEKFPYSMSGLMLLSEIEESNSGFKVTPFFSDNVAKLQGNFFTFFEVYNNSEFKKVNLAFILIDTSGNITEIGEVQEKKIEQTRSSNYLYINPKTNIKGKQLLRVVSLKTGTTDPLDPNNYLAVSERLVNFTPESLGEIYENIDLSIKQLRYVAPKDEIEAMQELTSKDDKIDAFNNYWKTLDPFPRTPVNEAMEQYYRRVKIANDSFKSYADGWITDMGRIYIILGQPTQVFANNNNMSSNRQYERWVYSNGREFLFEDRTGFGDFRLIRPLGFNQRYQYE